MAFSPCMELELKLAASCIQNRKACGLDEIPSQVWKLKDFHQTLLDMCNSVYNQDPIARWSEGCLLPFPKKGNLGITKNFRGITLTPIAAKIYNLMLLIRLRPEIDPILRKPSKRIQSKQIHLGTNIDHPKNIRKSKSENLTFQQPSYLSTSLKPSIPSIVEKWRRS